MEDESQQESLTASSYLRHRSPTFKKEEVKVLTDLVAKYKSIIFNKSNSSAANQAKDAVWVKIAETFNSQGFEIVRSMDSLKYKWDNMKREARKLSTNVKFDQLDELTAQIIAMMCEAENNPSPVDLLEKREMNIDSVLEILHRKDEEEKNCNNDENSDFEDSMDEDENDSSSLSKRSLNFSPRECKLLLQCVKQEKEIVFSKKCTTSFNDLKNRAWARITNSYNKLSPQKRSTKILRTKFTNMKSRAKNVSIKNYFKGIRKKRHSFEDSGDKIKAEPLFESREDLDDITLDETNNDDDTDDFKDLEDRSSNMFPNVDPLNTVLNTDLGMGAMNQVEDKEVVKLKIDLLNYKMETAKLQRRRIELLMQSDAADREAKALETSFRLRAARLETIAAEMKLPPNHPGLNYTTEEARAQLYTHSYHNS